MPGLNKKNYLPISKIIRNVKKCFHFKSLICLFLVSLFLLTPILKASSSSHLITKEKTHFNQPNTQLKGQLSISGAWALYPLAARWVEEFQKIYPGVKIDLQAGGAGKGMADVLSGLVDIALVSREVYPEEINRGALPLAVARDAVVATINQKNPFLNAIQKRGLNRKILREVWVEGKIKTWEELLGQKGQTPIHLYTRADACGAAETWAAYLGAHQEDLKGIAVFGDPGLAEAVLRDPLGLGFNNLNFAYNPQTGKPHNGLIIVPLDLNDDGLISPEENFYDSREKLIMAISSGLYPSPPARDLYLVITRPVRNNLIFTFLMWCLEKGQALVEEAGYVLLSPDILEREKLKLMSSLRESYPR